MLDFRTTLGVFVRHGHINYFSAVCPYCWALEMLSIFFLFVSRQRKGYYHPRLIQRFSWYFHVPVVL
jgi:hypothetical protein